MKNEFEPFAHPDPFDIPAGDSFAGWPAQILFEIKELLFDCSSDWLTAVASHIQELVTNKSADRIFDDADGPRESLAHSESGQFSLYRQPGHIGVFAALEPSVAWDKIKPPTERWQRYAVFALMYLRDSVKILARREQLQRNGRSTSDDHKYLALDLSEAAAWALEAMRALQIAHSLRIDARAKSGSWAQSCSGKARGVCVIESGGARNGRLPPLQDERAGTRLHHLQPADRSREQQILQQERCQQMATRGWVESRRETREVVASTRHLLQPGF